MTRPDAKNKWVTADRAAAQAETKVAAIGQAAHDPRVAKLCKTAADLRADADRLFKEMVEPEPKDSGRHS